MKQEINSESTFVFTKKNFQIMFLGIGFIILGFILMLGNDANTRPDGVFDKNYWNENIFSFTRIRLAPFFVVLGFIIEIYAIFYNDKKQINE